MSRRIAAHWILTPQGLQKCRIISFDDNGVVVDICGADDLDSLCGVEFYNGIVIPDMVNAHSHLELSYLKGTIKPHSGFVGFAEGLSQVRHRFSEQQREAVARQYDAVMYAQGVGAVADICNGTTTLGVKRESSIFYHSLVELFGLSTTDLSAVLPVAESFINAGLTTSITPHSTYSLNRAAFDRAVGATADGLLSIHFMESRAEAELFEGRGEMWEWYGRTSRTIDFADQKSPACRIVNSVDSSRRLLLIHNTFIREEDIVMLKERFGDNLTFVLCPRSNLFIEGRKADAELLRRYGCRIAIGTDSLASTDSLSMVAQIAEYDSVPLEERLFWITRNGAEALGLQDSLGSFVVGRRCGAVLIEGVDFEKMALGPDALSRRLL